MLEPDAESAFEHLRSQLENEIKSLLESSAVRLQDSAAQLLSELRSKVEDELVQVDRKTLATWSVLAAGGLVLGYVLGKRMARVTLRSLSKPAV